MESFQKYREKILKFKNPTIIHHYDTDGISSAAIMISFLLEHGIEAKTISLKGINKHNIEEIKDIPEKIVLDFGTNYVNELGESIIIDHHYPRVEPSPNLLNSHMIGLDGTKSISSAGLTSIVTGYYKPATALLGAMGDRQYPFVDVNKELFELAKDRNYIKVIRDLKAYGKYKRPLFVLLGYMFEDFALDKEQAKRFLNAIGIEQYDKNKGWKDYNSLSSIERIKFLKAVLEKAQKLGVIDEIYGEVYYLSSIPYIDMNELTSMINSTGRRNNAEVGIKLALGDQNAVPEAIKIWRSYQKSILNALEYAYENMENRNKYIWLDGRGKIDSSIIGVVMSILSSNKKNYTAIGASKDEEIVKISIRSNVIDVGKLVEQVINDYKDWEGGGHKLAGGFTIPEEDLDIFIKTIESRLDLKN